MSSSHTERYRSQHDELVAIVTSLTKNLTPEYVKANASPIKEALNILAGKVGIHLALEDQALYPRLLAHDNQTLRAQAQKFKDEMGGIRTTFDAYIKRWATSILIMNGADSFISDTNNLISVLGDRISRENDGLYTLIDQEGL